MQEERIKILSLLEQGVITVDEAVKLINAIQSIDINQEVHSYDVLNKMSDTIETIARDISKRTKTISTRWKINWNSSKIPLNLISKVFHSQFYSVNELLIIFKFAKNNHKLLSKNGWNVKLRGKYHLARKRMVRQKKIHLNLLHLKISIGVNE